MNAQLLANVPGTWRSRSRDACCVRLLSLADDATGTAPLSVPSSKDGGPALASASPAGVEAPQHRSNPLAPPSGSPDRAAGGRDIAYATPITSQNKQTPAWNVGLEEESR